MRIRGRGSRRLPTVILSAAALVTLALSAGSPAEAASPLCGPGATGRASSTITTSDNQVHTYWFHISPQAAPATGRPVFIWMHGDGSTTQGQYFGTEFEPVMDPDGAILITPNGSNIDPAWEHRAGDTPGHPYDSQFISRILDELDTCADVDHTKYFVGGASRGAFMPYYLLQRDSTRNRIAAAVVDAGLLYCQDGDPQCADDTDPVLTGASARILHLHGTNDTVVSPPPLARYHNPFTDDDWRVFWPMRFWAHQNGCFDGWNPPADNGVLRETYNANGHVARVYDLTGHGSACSKYQLILVDGGGHVIWNQQARIWAFLMRRPFSGPSFSCHGAKATIVGSPASETINGTSGRDVIVGLGGNDTIKGGGGNDVICGGAGNDVIDGGTGADSLYGDAGADQVTYRTRTEALSVHLDGKHDSGSAKDSRQDLIATDIEQAYGGSGPDIIVGNAAANRLYGGPGNDKLYGRTGTDYCSGGTGSDVGSSCESRSSIP